MKGRKKEKIPIVLPTRNNILKLSFPFFFLFLERVRTGEEGDEEWEGQRENPKHPPWSQTGALCSDLEIMT